MSEAVWTTDTRRRVVRHLHAGGGFAIAEIAEALHMAESKVRAILRERPGNLCPWCAQPLKTEYVRGHVECLKCRRVISDCCDGERAG